MNANQEFKKFRKDRKMSQGDFSKWTGIPVHTIQNWESERRKIKPWVLQILKLAK